VTPLFLRIWYGSSWQLLQCPLELRLQDNGLEALTAALTHLDLDVNIGDAAIDTRWPHHVEHAAKNGILEVKALAGRCDFVLSIQCHVAAPGNSSSTSSSQPGSLLSFASRTPSVMRS
jgi:hypothetical protein